MNETWYHIKPKNKHERRAPRYASLGGMVDGVQYVRLTNGAYVNFVTTQDECRERYVRGARCIKEDSKRIEDRYQWELHR